jgi:HAD superfamily hydrolase (TIGR01509 family)
LTSLVTFDFHNTIAYCDEWFYLEIRDLSTRTLQALAPDVFDTYSPDEIAARYREMRKAVMASGKEVEAVEGVIQITTGLGVELRRADVEATVARLMHDAAEHATPVPGAVESIRDVVSRGIRAGVVSSAVYHPFLEWTLERFGVLDALSFIMTSASSGYYKSDPEIYRTAMREVGSHPERSIHVGDSEKWDVWSAKQAGMRAIWFQNGDVDTLVDRPMEAEPDFTVTSMAEVGPWVIENLELSR